MKKNRYILMGLLLIMGGCGKKKSDEPKNLVDQVFEQYIAFGSYLKESPKFEDKHKNELINEIKAECPAKEDLQKLLNYYNCQIPILKLKANPKISVDQVGDECQSHVDGIAEACLIFTIQGPQVAPAK